MAERLRWDRSNNTLQEQAVGNEEIGRLLEPDYRRCGFVRTFREASLTPILAPPAAPHRTNNKTTVPSSAALTVTAARRDGAIVVSAPTAPSKRLSACWKCDVSDTQVNEIDALGEIVTVTKQPKGRWVKVAKRSTMTIEVDPKQEFGHPDKEYTTRVMDYGVYRRVRDRPPADRRWVYMHLYRQGATVDEVLSRFRHRAGVSVDSVHMGIEEDAFGCVAQLTAAVDVGVESVKHAARLYNINPIVISPTSYFAEPPSASMGRYYRVLLRLVEGTREQIESQLAWLSDERTRCANYVSLSGFGINANYAHEIGAMAAQGRYFDAVRCLMHNDSVAIPLLGSYYTQYLSAPSVQTERAVLEVALKQLEQHRLHRTAFGRIAEQLVALSSPWSTTATFPRSSSESSDVHHPNNGVDEPMYRDLWLHAAAERRHVYEMAPTFFVWNAAAAQRIVTGGAKVCVGDVVWNAAKGAVDLVTKGTATRWSVDDVVIPFVNPMWLMGPSATEKLCSILFPTVGATRDFCKEFCESQGFTQNCVGKSATSEESVFASPKGYRRLFTKAADVKYEIISDPNSKTVLKTDLFVAQERHVPTVGLPSGRIRMPSVVNTSPALEERLEALRKQETRRVLSQRDVDPRVLARDIPTHSVAISVRLPSGTHISTWLREAFDLRHVAPSELMTPVCVDAAMVASS